MHSVSRNDRRGFVGHVDSPGCLGHYLIRLERPFPSPAADRVWADAQNLSCLADAHPGRIVAIAEAGRIGRRQAGPASHVAYSSACEAIASGGPQMRGIQHERNLLVRVVRRHVTDQLIDLCARDVPVPTTPIQRAGQSGRCTTSPPDREIGDRSFAVDQDNHFGDEAAQEMLAVAIRRSWRLPDGFQIGPGPMQPLRIFVTERSRTTSPESGKFVLALGELLQSFFPGLFQRARNQTILRFDPSKLAFGPLGFISSPLHEQLALVALTLPGVFCFLERGAWVGLEAIQALLSVSAEPTIERAAGILPPAAVRMLVQLARQFADNPSTVGWTESRTDGFSNNAVAEQGGSFGGLGGHGAGPPSGDGAIQSAPGP